MKLVVQGIEEIEITDPQGLCNPPVPQLPAPLPNVLPAMPYGVGEPMNPPDLDGIVPTPLPAIPFNPRFPNVPADPSKWGVGGPMIQQVGEDAEKWQKNWQAKMRGEGQADGDGNPD